MIEELLPDTVVTVEAFGDEEPPNTVLYPEEEAVVLRAVDKRRREFAVVRSCARRAMEKLGVSPQPILPGECGAPAWPAGLAGSMTHCDGYGAAALVRATDLASLGIDAEPHQTLPEGVLPAVVLPAEADRLRRLAGDRPGIHWGRLLFSAKESVYKAWFPLTGRWLDFTEADIDVFADPGEQYSGGFRARLLVPGPWVGDRRVDLFEGRWTVRRGLVATAVSVPHS
ncbi:4'-phosphopantetheinyl transferase family protein [Streptomyces sp. CA-251387]|uniref:4'-phosphopantetheinyl transferase family protein n=1 Tax=Streptomyces sp. CA-251387 TaxID=3240064 RepID=UPI003D919824